MDLQEDIIVFLQPLLSVGGDKTKGTDRDRKGQ
jgi:hypothetical protein